MLTVSLFVIIAHNDNNGPKDFRVNEWFIFADNSLQFVTRNQRREKNCKTEFKIHFHFPFKGIL